MGSYHWRWSKSKGYIANFGNHKNPTVKQQPHKLKIGRLQIIPKDFNPNKTFFYRNKIK